MNSPFRQIITMSLAALSSLFFSAAAIAEDPYEIAWIESISYRDVGGHWVWGSGVAVDVTGNAFVTGWVDGDLFGPITGFMDAFLAKYDADGNLVWGRQPITSAWREWGNGVAVGPSGEVIFTGLSEPSSANGSLDQDRMSVAKFDTEGNMVWSRESGSMQDARIDSNEVVVDASGSAFISGQTDWDPFGPNAGGRDAFLVKYDTEGNFLWGQQFGTAENDRATEVAADASGNVFVTGETSGSLFGPNSGDRDMFLSKYDTEGNLLWGEQLGLDGSDGGGGVAVDAWGNAFVAGWTQGSLSGPSAGDWDAILLKYDTEGNLLWTQQLGTAEADWANEVAVDASGNVFVAGPTRGSLGGSNADSRPDTFLSKYDTAGNLLWTYQLATNFSDMEKHREGYVNDIAVDISGNVFIIGHDVGNDTILGFEESVVDMFLVKFANTAAPVRVGDLNADSAVDAADAGIMIGNWGSSGLGDLNGDAIVDAVDAGVMFAEWTGDAQPRAIPEPATATLLFLAILGIPILCGRPDM